MREKAVTFGKTAKLVGVLCEPTGDVRRAGAPCVVLLNSGLLHRVGAHRLHVKLARALSQLGVTTLRFDFSGLGDSDVRKDSLPFEQSGPLEVREAMDFLAGKAGATHFVLVGLCSGADMAFSAACTDDRVVGLAQMDGFVYKTWQYYPRRFGPKLFNLRSVRGFVQEHAGNLLRRGGMPSGAPAEDFVQSPYVREFPPQDAVETGLRLLVDRGVQLFNFFSREHYGYKRQYIDCFRSVRFDQQLQLEFMPRADHTLADTQHQSQVVSQISGWYSRLWLGGSAPARVAPGAQAAAVSAAS